MSARKRIAILGAGGHGKVVLDAVLEAGVHDVAGFLDDDPQRTGSEVLGVPIVGTSQDLVALKKSLPLDGVIVAIGDNHIRRAKMEQVLQAQLECAGVVHPSARISRFARVGQGVVIFAGVVVNPGTDIEDNVCLNTGASVDHDNLLGHSCHVFPQATLTGGVRVGEFTSIGSNATVNPYVSIGRNCMVGSGSVVLRDVPDDVVVAGVPARVIREQIQKHVPTAVERNR